MQRAKNALEESKTVGDNRYVIGSADLAEMASISPVSAGVLERIRRGKEEYDDYIKHGVRPGTD